MKIICGLDEAGRGPLAGPIVAAAVIMSSPIPIPIKDSKLLTRTQREKIYDIFIKSNHKFATTTISSRIINKKGIGWTNKEIFRRLIKKIPADLYIIDGNLKINHPKVISQIDADAKVLPVIMAGIVAKVTRDKLMENLHQKYPLYNWAQNAGYGTKEHIKAIITYGKCREHREQFVKTALQTIVCQRSITDSSSMKAHNI